MKSKYHGLSNKFKVPGLCVTMCVYCSIVELTQKSTFYGLYKHNLPTWQCPDIPFYLGFLISYV